MWPRKGNDSGDQEKNIWNFYESWILPLEFPRGVKQFLEIPGVKLYFV